MQKIIFYLFTLFVLGGGGMSVSYANAHHTFHAVMSSKENSKAPVNINNADIKALTTLKGIGLKKAQAIVDYRQAHGNFKSLQDLASVRGIGKKALTRIMKNNPSRLVLAP